MFRALYAHHQEVEFYWYSIWYRPLSQWPSGAQVERELLCCTNKIQPPDDEHIMLETCRDFNKYTVK